MNYKISLLIFILKINWFAALSYMAALVSIFYKEI